MSAYQALYRKYRPQTFAQVAGQDMVTAVLSRAAAEDRVAAAYLLSGTRGVGKTTIARIFAKALNCRHAPGPEPCNQCDQCRKITQGSHVDVTPRPDDCIAENDLLLILGTNKNVNKVVELK